MPIAEKTVRTYLKVRALSTSSNRNEASIAARKAQAMEQEHPGLRERAERLARAENSPGQQGQLTPEMVISFLRGAYDTINNLADSVSSSLRGVAAASRIRITRSTRGKNTFLTLVLPTTTLNEIRHMNEFQQAAFQEELLRRVEAELDALL